LSRKAVHNWVEKSSQGRSKVADDAWPGAEVVETTVKKLLCWGFWLTGKAMWQVYQCWWRICRQIFFFFPVSNISCFTFYIHFWPIYWLPRIYVGSLYVCMYVFIQADVRMHKCVCLQAWIPTYILRYEHVTKYTHNVTIVTRSPDFRFPNANFWCCPATASLRRVGRAVPLQRLRFKSSLQWRGVYWFPGL
jgi:hypothetical protein